MAYAFLDGEWEDNVRSICGGVSSSVVSDALLALDAYAPSSESRIKELVTDWATLKVTYPTEFNRAAYYHVASKVCSLLTVKMLSSERVGGDYSYTMQKIDWNALANAHLMEFYKNLAMIDPTVVGTLTVIDISHRDPAYLEELIVEDVV